MCCCALALDSLTVKIPVMPDCLHLFFVFLKEKGSKKNFSIETFHSFYSKCSCMHENSILLISHTGYKGIKKNRK